MLSLMDTMVSLVVKVLYKFISLICFRVCLEVNVYKNTTCFSCWSVSNAGLRESHPHDVEITSEAPNYTK